MRLNGGSILDSIDHAATEIPVKRRTRLPRKVVLPLSINTQQLQLVIGRIVS